MIKKLLSGSRKSLIRKLYDEAKKDLDSPRIDSNVWAHIQASALVGDDSSSCVRCRR